MANSDSQLSLEIVIKSIADREGIRLTDEDFKKLQERFSKGEIAAADLTKAIREAGSKSEDFGQSLNKLANDDLLALEEKLRAQIKAEQELGKNTDELKAKLTSVFEKRTSNLDLFNSLNDSGKKAAESVGTVEKQIHSLKTASAGASQVLNGLAQGGLGGLMQAGRGVITVFTSLAGTAIGAVAIPALAAAGVAFKVLSSIVDSNRAAIDKWYKESSDRTTKMKAAVEALDAAAAKALQDQLNKVQALDRSYAQLTSQIDKARQRTDALNKAETERRLAEIDAREAEALGKAPTDEAKSAVQKKFAQDRQLVRDQSTDTDITNKKLGAQTDKIAAEEQLQATQETIDAAQAAAKAAQKAFEDARDTLTQFTKDGGDLTSTYGRDLSDAANKAKRAAENAQKNFDEVTTAQAPRRQAAQDKLDDAKLTEQIADIERQKFDAEKRSAAAAKRVADAKEREARIAEEVANGASKAQAEARERPNQGGTITVNGQTKQVGAKPTLTQAEREAADAIASSKKPTSFSPDQISVTPGREKIPDLSPDKAASVDAALKEFFGEIDSKQKENVSAVQDLTQKVASTPPLPIGELGQAIAQKDAAQLQAMQLVIQQQQEQAKQIAALQNGLQATREATQS